jgi:hypothetical protein
LRGAGNFGPVFGVLKHCNVTRRAEMLTRGRTQMRTCLIMLFAALGTSISLPAQTQAQAPQTARQALIEMFLSHEAETFAKHLPDTARKLLPLDGGEPYSSIMFLISSFDNRRFLRSQCLETFDDGPTILMSEQSEVDKMEVAVEHDILAGENEEIELSAHFYHDGREQSLFVIPRWIFTRKQEKKIWRLIEVTAAARVPLTDPDYLRGLRQQEQEANESAALTRVGIITAAEAGYADQHPDHGYTCARCPLFSHPSRRRILQMTMPSNRRLTTIPARAELPGADTALRSPAARKLQVQSFRSQPNPSTQIPARRRSAPTNLQR